MSYYTQPSGLRLEKDREPIDPQYSVIDPQENPINNSHAHRVSIYNRSQQDKHKGTHLAHDFLVKGTFTTTPGTGIGYHTRTFDRFISCSLDWVLQHNWAKLHIKPLDAVEEEQPQEDIPLIVEEHLEEVIPTPPKREGEYTWKMAREDRYFEWVAMKNREWTRNGGHYDAT